MKALTQFITPVIFLGLAGVPAGHFGQAQAQIIQWNVQPPNYYNDIGRRAFHDGIEAAQRDFQARRDMDPWHNPQVRNPPVPGNEREHYRDAFLRGYDQGMHRARGWNGHYDNGWHGDPDQNWRDQDHNQNPR